VLSRRQAAGRLSWLDGQADTLGAMKEPTSPRLQIVIRGLALSEDEVRECFRDSSDVAKVDVAAEVVELLDRRLRAGRLPAVARKPAEAYDGLTMVGMLAADRQVELLADVRSSFDLLSLS
jgi:hypothetical protein